MTEAAADEQDLAKALDSVASAASSLDGSSSVHSDDSSSSGFGGGGLPPIVPPNSPVAPASTPALPTYPSITPVRDSGSSPDQFNSPTPVPEPPTDTSTPPVETTSNTSDTVVESGPLADIKKDALNELRPLVDKLDVSPEEKFDTYLLLIRSTDDTELVGPAHEAAKAITDEAKRAEALLEIIKEIDYLSRKK